MPVDFFPSVKMSCMAAYLVIHRAYTSESPDPWVYKVEFVRYLLSLNHTALFRLYSDGVLQALCYCYIMEVRL